MKKMKRFMSLMLALVLAMAMGITAFAQTVTVGSEGATITINNPAKGETYSIYKLFDATVTEDGKIAYQGTVPDSLSAFFEADANGNISPKDSIIVKDEEGKVTGTEMTDELKAALEAWAKDATATSTAVSDGSGDLEFTGVPYGYYVVTTSHESDAEEGEEPKAAITVTSTTPNASIFDKNVNEPSAKKEVEKESYSIGDTVKYTGTFDTTNYMGEGENSKQVINYLISDTLPEYLSDVKVTSVKIMVGETEVDNITPVPQFSKVADPADSTKTIQGIMLPWATKEADGTYTNKYAQGAQIVITYEAQLTSVTNINKDDTNTISIRPYVDNGNGTEGGDPWDRNWEDTAVIRTYAAAIKKVDENGEALAGAEFTFKGLTVEAVGDKAGVYKVVSYDPSSETESEALATDEEGKLYIVGLASDVKLVVTEFKAPNGYNKLVDKEELTPQIMTETIYATSGTEYYDKDGNLVSSEENASTNQIVENNLSTLDVNALEIVNQRGTLLPSTGGIGTTIFYVVGGILVVAAGILLVTKKRMSAR